MLANTPSDPSSTLPQTNGDIEDSPGLDSLHKYSVEPISSASDPIRITADLDNVTSKKGRTPCADRAKVTKRLRSGDAKGAEQTVIVIGGGSGGSGVIEGLREVSCSRLTPLIHARRTDQPHPVNQLGFKGKITMLSSEPHPPIDRTKLSKALIADPSKITLRSLEEYTSAPFDIDLRTSTLVESVDLKEKTLKIEGGGEEKWDKLVFATGAKPRDLPVDGKDLEGVHKLRTIEHAKAIDSGTSLSFSALTTFTETLGWSILQSCKRARSSF